MESRPIILKSVDHDFSFKLKIGSEITNLSELVQALEIMDDETFSHHVSKKNNDFANWVKDIILDNKLSLKLKKSKTKKKMIKLIDNRIHSEIKHIQKIKIKHNKSHGKSMTKIIRNIKKSDSRSTEIKNLDPKQILISDSDYNKQDVDDILKHLKKNMEIAQDFSGTTKVTGVHHTASFFSSWLSISLIIIAGIIIGGLLTFLIL